jgi:hypothetical protein
MSWRRCAAASVRTEFALRFSRKGLCGTHKHTSLDASHALAAK